MNVRNSTIDELKDENDDEIYKRFGFGTRISNESEKNKENSPTSIAASDKSRLATQAKLFSATNQNDL